jgi:hypothetical protein
MPPYFHEGFEDFVQLAPNSVGARPCSEPIMKAPRSVIISACNDRRTVFFDS